MLFGFLIFIQVVTAFVLVFLVLLQGGRGAELGAAFGGTGQAQTIRGTMTGIAKVTAVAGAIFMATSLSLAYLSTKQATDSVVSEIQAPEVPAAQSVDEPSAESVPPTEEKTAESAEQSDAPELEQTDAPPVSTETQSEN